MAVSPTTYQDSGTSQQGRRLPALPPGQVRLADYSTERLLAYVAHFSKLVRFYEVFNGQVESRTTWDLANRRSLLIIALIATQRLPAQYEYYNKLIQDLRDPLATTGQRQGSLKAILGRIYKMAELFDKWNEAHQTSHQRRTFQAELTAATEDLTGQLQQAVRFEAELVNRQELPPRDSKERQPEKLVFIWRAPQAGPPPSADTEAIKHELVEILWKFHKAQTSLAGLAHRVLIRSLRGGQVEDHRHLPEMGLLVTFLELYQYAQNALNDIPQRHLDYYYQQVLRVATRPARPDYAFLTFGLTKAVTDYVLPAGTEVEGGKDATGNRVVFRTTEDQQLTPWRVQQFSTLFVSGHGSDSVKGIYAAPHADSADGLGQLPLPAEGWAPFGEDQDLISPAYRTMTDAAVGFAVSAAVLLLQEGRRSIELSLRCEPDSFRRFTEVLTQDGEKPLQRTFDAISLAAFRVDITGAEGWLPVRVQEVSLEPGRHTLTWHLTLERNQPAVVPHQPALHAGRFSAAWPVLRLVLNERAPEYAYSSFGTLQPQKIGLRVRAQDVQGVQLSNQLGPLVPGLPFAPFGPQPGPGAYLLLSYAELFRKRLTELVLTFDWAQLLTEPGGFADYYQGYGQPIDNDSFRVGVSYRRDWRWVPEALPVGSVSLFQTIPDPARRTGTALLPASHLVLKTAGTADFRHTPAAPAGGFQPDGATGAIRLELVAPAMGFGTEQYPTLLVETLQHNARTSKPRPLPRPPFVPMVKSIWLSYAAEEEIDVATLFGPETATRQQFYYVHPLADYQPTRPAAPGDAARPAADTAGARRASYALPLLPEFEAEGTLYIGLSQLTPPQTINLLFELSPLNRLPREASASGGEGYVSRRPKVRWAYLVQDEWRPFAKGTTLRNDVVRDQSNSLTELQPVYLTLPPSLNTRHAIMPDGLFWIRATVERGAAQISRVRAVHAQVVPAVRTNAQPGQPADFVENLPAQSLTRLAKPQPELARVTQPLRSFAGRPAESREEYYVRVSERLRHRGRAVTPWDYEHLVLDQFPEVYRVKCLRADQVPARLRRPGHLMVIVMPYQPTAAADDAAGHRLPNFSPGRLESIRAMLARAASPHVRLEVCNPLYEVIHVRCRVRYTSMARRGQPQPGALTQQLKQDLTAFLSPWNPLNTTRQGLHYSLTSSMVLSFLNQLPYVEYVTAFSVVKMALENDQYLFFDTEALAPDGISPDELLARAQPLEDASHRPWSVYVSAWQHDIEEIGDGMPRQDLPLAQPTGIGSLVIGADFVIPRSFEADADARPAR